MSLDDVDHLVVLMLENRSFDHLLGYLTLGGRTDVNGLDEEMFSVWQGQSYPVYHLPETVVTPSPCHQSDGVAQQIADPLTGFVASSAKDMGPDRVKQVMGYYAGDDVPVYDALAAEYTICDHWFCSVPGDTFANRLYAFCGTSDGVRDGRVPPIYDRPTFFRNLDDAKRSWRAYKHNFHTPKLIDGRYRVDPDEHFAPIATFFDDAKSGKLADVTWIDPLFNLGDLSKDSANDDHPSTDILRGQQLAFDVYQAVRTSPCWPKTLLLIVYDEHGGFFDHAVPSHYPATPDVAGFDCYGPRVPALLISPFVAKGGVCNEIFDHTSLIKTILWRFCRAANGVLPELGRRVQAATHLGSALVDQPRIDDAQLAELPKIQARLNARKKTSTTVAQTPSGLGTSLRAARDELRRRGMTDDEI